MSFIPPLEGHLVIEDSLVIVLAYFSGRTSRVPTSGVTWVPSEMNFSSPGHAAEHGIRATIPAGKPPCSVTSALVKADMNTIHLRKSA